ATPWGKFVQTFFDGAIAETVPPAVDGLAATESTDGKSVDVSAKIDSNDIDEVNFELEQAETDGSGEYFGEIPTTQGGADGSGKGGAVSFHFDSQWPCLTDGVTTEPAPL